MAAIEAVDAPPTLLPDERLEMFLLARHFHVRPRAARFDLEGWEIDVLLEGLMNESKAAPDG